MQGLPGDTPSAGAAHGDGSVLAVAVGKDLKGKLSLLAYVVAIPSAFLSQWIAGALYVLVAVIWLVPDPRIERAMERGEEK